MIVPEWQDDIGRVRLVVTGLAAANTIYRVDISNYLRPVRGFSDNVLWVSGGAGLAYDYEMPLGASVGYVEAPLGLVNKTYNPLTPTYVETPGNIAWLRDPSMPHVSMLVTVIATEAEAEEARQTVYRVAGRRGAVVVHDVRNAKTGAVTLLIQNDYTQEPAPTITMRERDKLEQLVASGNVLLLAMCYAQGFDASTDVNVMSGAVYLAVGSVSWERLWEKAAWKVTLEYVEVDWPRVGINIPVDASYATQKDKPTVLATYQAWLDTFTTYHNLLIDAQGAQP